MHVARRSVLVRPTTPPLTRRQCFKKGEKRQCRQVLRHTLCITPNQKNDPRSGKPSHGAPATHFSHSPYETASEGERTSEYQPVHVRWTGGGDAMPISIFLPWIMWRTMSIAAMPWRFS